MLLRLLLSLLRLPASDLNLFLQFIITICFALALLYFIKYTASNYFVIDANIDPSSSSSSLIATDIKGDSPVSEMESPNPPCVVCSKPTTKHCSGCKLVRYCSESCQRSHWNSAHKNTCKSFQVSSKANLKLSAGGLHNFATKSSKNFKDPKEILFPYEKFVQLFNWEKPGNPPCGLLNCGNSCFANVVLQCLACTRPLVSYLLEKGHQRECRRNDWCFMCELQSHVIRATQTLQPFSPLNILSRLPNIGGNLGYGKQEDAHEFMRFAIDTMQSVCLDEFGGEKTVHPRAQETTLIQYIFGGQLQSQVICEKCGNVSNQFENMMDLTVEMQGDAASLEECLDQFTIRERLHGDNMYKCDGCNDYVLAWKRLSIRQAPNILTIALKRFQSGRFGKLNKRVSFPETLDLSPYMSEAGNDSDVYKLYAVVVHVDMLNASYFGHYICYTKDFSGNWYRIDDCKVHRVELDEVLSQGAYMLLYSRVCVRTSCLNTKEPPRKHGEEKLEAAQEVVPGANTTEKVTVVNSTDVPLVCGPLPDSISQSMNIDCDNAKDVQLMNIDCDNAKDVQMVDLEVNLSAPKDADIYDDECSTTTEGSISALSVSQGNILELNSSTPTEPTHKEPELPLPVSYAENKDDGVGSSTKQQSSVDSLDCNIEPYSNGVFENGAAAASSSTCEASNESHQYSAGLETEKVEESRNGKAPCYNTDIGNIGGGELHNSSEFGGIHTGVNSIKIVNYSLSGEQKIPVSNGSSSVSTNGVVSDKAHCSHPNGKPQKMEIDKGFPILLGTGEGKKDGRKYSGPKPKPLFRPGFLGKHPREKHIKKAAVVAPGEASPTSSKVNGYSSNIHVEPDTSNGNMEVCEDGEHTGSIINTQDEDHLRRNFETLM